MITTQLKKNRERFFADLAGKLLNKTWILGPDREAPDFFVTEGTNQFGLELCEIFTGAQSPRAGSAMKTNESHMAKTIEVLRREYEAKANIPLRVHLVGNVCPETLALVVPALIAEDFASKPVAYRVKLVPNTGLRAGLSIHVIKAHRPEWFSGNDRVGWVDHNPMPRIIAAVTEKSKKLREYQQAVGADIRLLVFADRINNSGKLSLDEQMSTNLQGFRAIYFLSYPHNIVVFGDATW
jgi:hypothetical protein